MLFRSARGGDDGGFGWLQDGRNHRRPRRQRRAAAADRDSARVRVRGEERAGERGGKGEGERAGPGIGLLNHEEERGGPAVACGEAEGGAARRHGASARVATVSMTILQKTPRQHFPSTFLLNTAALLI